MILAVRLPNWVGDVVMALPALGALQGAGFSLHAFGRPWACDLLAGCPFPVTGLPRDLKGTVATLRQSGGRHGILFTNSFGSALAMRRAGIAVVGYRGDWRRWLLTAAPAKTAGRHEVEHFHHLATVAKDLWQPEAQWGSTIPERLHLPIADGHREEATRIRLKYGLSDGYWVLCPHATGTIRGRSKIWPLWRELSNTLAGHGHTLVVCPGPGEEVNCQQAVPHAMQITGLGLGTYAAILAGATQVVANDSGPMHLAAAAGVPVLGIFGVGDPVRTRPWGGRFVGSASGWPDLATVLAALPG